METLNKEQFISKKSDIERVYLISIHDGKIYLRADIEKGGDNGLRIEMMDFKIDTSYGLHEANSLCRSNYPSGISFIEYNSYNEAEHRILDDFLNIDNKAVFQYCNNDELRQVLSCYLHDENKYIIIE